MGEVDGLGEGEEASGLGKAGDVGEAGEADGLGEGEESVGLGEAGDVGEAGDIGEPGEPGDDGIDFFAVCAGESNSGPEPGAGSPPMYVG